MSEAAKRILSFPSDGNVLLAVHCLLAIVLLVAAYKDLRQRLGKWWRKKRKATHKGGMRVSATFDGEVIRGPVSRQQLFAAYGFILAILLQLINVSEAWTGHKVLASVLDTVIMLYLSLFNGWFRNLVIGLIAQWEKRPER